jgi:hypothetical protein
MTRVRPARLRRWSLAAACSLLIGALGACSSTSRIEVRCDPSINEGLLLTVDLVQVSDEEARQIQQTGDQWFYSDLRRQLALRTKTIAVEGGCSQKVELTRHKHHDILAVIADYHGSTQMVFKGKKEWLGRTLDLGLHDTHLTIEEG